MDLIDGVDMKEFLKMRPLKGNNEMILRIIKCLLKALQALHKNKIIHRDIKPGNIMINEKENCRA